MRICIVSVGKQMPAWVEQAFQAYQKRLPSRFQLQLTEVPAGRRTKGADLVRISREETKRILAAVPDGYRIIALERTGKTMTSTQLAAAMKDYMNNGENLAIITGGPEGLDDECLEKANEVWSLSALTLAHPVVRVVLAEQLYRAWSIIQNHPYHR
ncbi:MAG: 23S rRNA (pseudouridine(1915)-N(3))-methyltransferase RlmH [Gammaproteobacteria bacterium]|nr:MAG: 23S rRNA (pseudouridine(1915)-N(3))-methyltransferase RlmH [Gammaproteobacteria bacterium]